MFNFTVPPEAVPILNFLGHDFLEQLGAMEYFIFLINIVIFFTAAKILRLFNPNTDKVKFRRKLKHLRTANLTLFVSFFLITLIDAELFQKVIMTGTSALGVFLFWEFEMYYIQKNYTKETQDNDGNTQILETYQSDIFKWLATIVTIIISVNIVSDIWDWDSLWQTGSVVASIAAFLAITHGSWLPDNIGGLITLHRGHIEAGDVVSFKTDGEEILGYVGKIALTETTLFDLVDKHPIYLRNSKLRDATIHRLSKNGSGVKEGILRCIDLNIGYDSKSEVVEKYAEDVFKRAIEITNSINKERKIRVEILNNGDYAVTWRFLYYANARNMKDAEYAMNRAAKDIAEEYSNISLDTPLLVSQQIAQNLNPLKQRVS